jgi:hypothetical protein
MTPEEWRAHEAKQMGENKQLLPEVMKRLKQAGWNLVYHTWNSIHSAKGFLDIFAIYVSQEGEFIILIAELKREGMELTTEQARWHAVWRMVAAIVNRMCDPLVRFEVHVWRPSDLLSGAIDAVIFLPTGVSIPTLAAQKKGWGHAVD